MSSRTQRARSKFDFHPATTDQRKFEHERVRNVLGRVAVQFDAILPDGREKAMAMTKLQETLWAATAAVALQDDEEE